MVLKYEGWSIALVVAGIWTAPILLAQTAAVDRSADLKALTHRVHDAPRAGAPHRPACCRPLDQATADSAGPTAS